MPSPSTQGSQRYEILSLTLFPSCGETKRLARDILQNVWGAVGDGEEQLITHAEETSPPPVFMSWSRRLCHHHIIQTYLHALVDRSAREETRRVPHSRRPHLLTGARLHQRLSVVD